MWGWGGGIRDPFLYDSSGTCTIFQHFGNINRLKTPPDVASCAPRHHKILGSEYVCVCVCWIRRRWIKGSQQLVSVCLVFYCVSAQTDFTSVSEEIVGGEIKSDCRVIIRDAQNKNTHARARIAVNAKRRRRTQLKGAMEENNNVTRCLCKRR